MYPEAMVTEETVHATTISLRSPTFNGPEEYEDDELNVVFNTVLVFDLNVAIILQSM